MRDRSGLLDASDIRENEQVHIWNIDNGERLVTYAICARAAAALCRICKLASERVPPAFIGTTGRSSH